jgi:Vitamin B6 photo-protection and homoeostasis
MMIDLLSPAFPKPLRVGVLAGSSVLRSLCGVAAGSAKASLSAHFAKQGNLGEVNAKDESQETVISLLGMLAGTAVVSVVTGKLATWITLLALLAIHLAMNTAAVRAVRMRSLNRQRANIVFSRLLAIDKVLRPKQVSALEWIFERDGVLRWNDGVKIGHCKIGVGLDAFVRLLGDCNARSRSTTMREVSLIEILTVFAEEEYLMWPDFLSRTEWIVLKQGCNARSQLKAWCHGLLLAKEISGLEHVPNGRELLGMVKKSLDQTTNSFGGYAQRLEAAGWDLDVAALETQSGARAVVKAHVLLGEDQ